MKRPAGVLFVVLALSLGFLPGHARASMAVDPDRALNLETELRTLEDEATATGALGFYTDPSSGYVVVVVSALESSAVAIDSTAAPDYRVHVETRPITANEIADAKTALLALRSSPALDGATYGFSFDPPSGTIAVQGSVSAAVMKALVSPQLWSLMSYTQAEGPGRLSRNSDVSPFWGGAKTTDESSTCTTGFEVKNASGTKYLVTAGHCFPYLDTVWSPGSLYVQGKIRSVASFPSYDMALIGDKLYGPEIYTGDATGVGSIVKGASDPTQGSGPIYCYSGAFTYDNCNYTDVDNDATLCLPDGCTLHMAKLYFGGCNGINGDSGAPVYLDFALGGHPYIRGILIANYGTYCWMHKWSTISSQLGVSIVTG